MTEAEWFASAAETHCALHRTAPASTVCGRCGRFTCDECQTDAMLCAPCVTHKRERQASQLARGIGVKLLLLPVLGTLSLIWLMLRHSPLADDVGPALTPWVVPLFCGLRLLGRPSLTAAMLGSTATALLLLWQLAPGLTNGVDATRAFELLILLAAPAVALMSTVKLASLSPAP